IVFGARQYQPQTDQGRRLIAHELTHTLQQRSSTQQESGKLKTASPDDASEREANAATEAVMNSQRVTATMGSGPNIGLQVALQEGPAPADAATPDAGVGGGSADGGPAPAPDGGVTPAPPAIPAPPAPGPAPAAPVVTDITVANQAEAITYPVPSVLGGG